MIDFEWFYKEPFGPDMAPKPNVRSLPFQFQVKEEMCVGNGRTFKFEKSNHKWFT